MILSIGVLLHVAITPAWSDAPNRASPSKIQWSKYAAKTFSSHLNEKERKQLSAAVAELDCSAIERLQSQGFFRMHPDLKSALKDTADEATFYREVVRRLNDYAYCDTMEEIDAILDFAATRKIRLAPVKLSENRPVVTFDERLGSLPSRKNTSLRDKAQNSLCSALSSLFRMALYERNTAATGGLLRFSRRAGLLELSPTQAYFLTAQAIVFKLPEVGAATSVPGPIYHRVKGTARSEVDRYLAAGTPMARVPYIAGGSCGYPGLLPSDGLSYGRSAR